MNGNRKNKYKPAPVWGLLWKTPEKAAASGKILQKKAVMVTVVCISILLTACGGLGQSGQTGDSEGDPAVSKEVSSEAVSGSSSEVSSGASSGAPAPEQQETEKQQSDISESSGLPQPYARYLEVLEQIKTEGRDPNGREYYNDENHQDFQNNCFAILDVDGDGRQELIFNYNESSMGSMCEVVYEYDPETDTLREELKEWVSTEYYNGLVKVQMTHNHGRDPYERGGWPYLLYQYDPEEDNYRLSYIVDAWDGEIYEKDFPYELDTDGDKLLYCITVVSEEPDGGVPDDSREELIYDRAEFEAWEEELMMTEWNRLNVIYHPMTEESMEKLKSAYIQAAAYAAQADIWFIGEEAGPVSRDYLLYDMDGDGVLELLASVMQGTGRYSDNYFYSLADGGKVTKLPLVRLCNSKEREWNADFDIGGGIRIQAYRDRDGILYFEGNDYTRDGIYVVYVETGFYYLKDGVVYQDSIRCRTQFFHEGDGQQDEVYYYKLAESADGRELSEEEITEEQYEAIRQKYIEDMTEIRVHQNWIYFMQDDLTEGKITEDMLCERLFQSFLGSE